MSSKSKGRQKDKKCADAIKRRQIARDKIEERKMMKELGLL